MESTGIVEPPPVVSPPPQPRNSVGWVLLIAMLLVLTLGELALILDGQDSKFSRYELVVQALELDMMGETMLTPSKARSSRLQNLDNEVSRLAKAKKTDSSAAKLYAIIRHEQGYTLTDKDLSSLKNSTKIAERLSAEVYGPGSLEPARAKKIETELKSGDFADHLMAIHALEKSGDKTARDRLLKKEDWPIKVGAFAAVLFAAFLGCGLWVLYFLQRIQGRWSPKGNPLKRISLFQADSAALKVAFFLVLFAIVPTTVYLIFQRVLTSEGVSAIGSVALFVLLLLLLRVRPLQKGIALRQVVGDTSRLGSKVIWGFAGAIANVPIVIAATMIGYALFSFLPTPSHPAVEDLMQSKSLLGYSLFFLMASVLAPISEELVFRGLLFPAISKVMRSVPKGIFWSSLAFACIHPQGPVLWLSLAAIGAMGALLSHQTGSLISSMVMHMVHNTGLLVLIAIT